MDLLPFAPLCKFLPEAMAQLRYISFPLILTRAELMPIDKLVED